MQPFVHSFISGSFIDSFIAWFLDSFCFILLQSCMHACMRACIHSFIHSCIHSFIQPPCAHLSMHPANPNSMHVWRRRGGERDREKRREGEKRDGEVERWRWKGRGREQEGCCTQTSSPWDVVNGRAKMVWWGDEDDSDEGDGEDSMEADMQLVKLTGAIAKKIDRIHNRWQLTHAGHMSILFCLVARASDRRSCLTRPQRFTPSMTLAHRKKIKGWTLRRSRFGIWCKATISIMSWFCKAPAYNTLRKQVTLRVEQALSRRTFKMIRSRCPKPRRILWCRARKCTRRKTFVIRFMSVCNLRFKRHQRCGEHRIVSSFLLWWLSCCFQGARGTRGCWAQSLR